ncbi:MAG: CDP-alcohol phosphatidyltransferase family protein [Ignisphaera sp.]|uniref:CDP-alcohol phosphatidyltransferase family protein n=1 Tax=Ignisphaera aggregans TaxID=334771 RepID=A0A7C4NKX8_9CREN
MVIAIITRLRRIVSRYLEIVAINLYKLGLTPNSITLLGLAISVVGLIAAYLSNIVAVLLIFLISSLMDVLDGALARVSSRVTRLGSILDSFSDKVEEGIFFYSILILGAPITLVLLSLIVSYLISYLRALGENNGVRLEGIGILERGERLILIAIAIVGLWLGNSALVHIALIALIILGCVTIMQRLFHIYKNV